MNYTTEFIEKVKAAADIIAEAKLYFADIVANLDGNNYTTMCECGGKIGLNREKNFYKCFGVNCDNKGDIYGLLQRYGKMSFTEAVLHLANKYHIELETNKNGAAIFGRIEIIKKNNISFVPNSFQTPNAYIDVLCHLLTAEEFKVLIYVTRRIFGYENKREFHQDNISISQIEKGQKKKSGEVISEGVGLSHPTIVKCLKNMCRFGIIRKVGNASKIGQLIELSLDSSNFDWDSMYARLDKNKKYEKKKAKDRYKAKKRRF